jgi:2'-5' RNA ligase
VQPPEAMRRELAGFTTALGHPQLRRVPAENLHVTVLFLGDVPAADVPELGERLAWVAGREPAFRLELGHALPAPARRPRMLWALVAPSEALLRLSRDLHAAARRLAPEQAKPLRGYGHITLARFRSEVPGLAATTLDLSPSSFDVTELLLMESQLSPAGARYDVQAALSLGEPASPG